MSSNWPKSLTSAHSTTVVPLKRDGSIGVHTIIRLRYGAGGQVRRRVRLGRTVEEVLLLLVAELRDVVTQAAGRLAVTPRGRGDDRVRYAAATAPASSSLAGYATSTIDTTIAPATSFRTLPPGSDRAKTSSVVPGAEFLGAPFSSSRRRRNGTR